ncbi:MAG: DUF3823 domain-containing protein [Niabella sp.]
MKKLLRYIMLAIPVLYFVSCSKPDNYAEPGETIKGKIVDVNTGEPVLTDQGSEGTRIRLRELSWKETPTPDNFDFWCMKEGVYQNTKVFAGTYNVRIDGAFIPLVRLNSTGDTIANESKTVQIKGVTEVDFQVQPFLKVEWVEKPTVSNGVIKAKVKVTRGVSREDFRAKIEPMGNYSDNFLNVTDIQFMVSESPFVGYRTTYNDNRRKAYEYSGNTFEPLLGTPIEVTHNGVIQSGRTVFVRAAARINYATEGIRRWNYNEAIRVDVP